MAFSTSLALFRDLVSKATTLATPSAPGSGESFPLDMSKDDTARQFQGAIFELVGSEGHAFACPPVAKHASNGVELVLSGDRIGSSRKYRKSEWMDRHVTRYAMGVLNSKTWFLGGAPTTFSVPKDGDEDAVFEELLVASGGNVPYHQGIDDVMAMQFSGSSGNDGDAKLQWLRWVPRAAPTAAPPAAPVLGLAAADLGGVEDAPRVILAALGVRPDGASGELGSIALGHLIATLGGQAHGCLAVTKALQPGPGHDEFMAELIQAFDGLYSVDSRTLADAAIDAREAVLACPASVPTHRAAVLGDALRRALKEVATQLKADSDAGSADEAGGAGGSNLLAVVRPASDDPAVRAYIEQLESRLAGPKPQPPGAAPRPPPLPAQRSHPLALRPPTSAAAALRAGRAGLASVSPLPPPTQPPLDASISEALAAFFPAEAAGRLAGDASGDRRRQHALAIGGVLLFEVIPARHAHHPGSHALLGELGRCVEAELHFAAGADEDALRLAIGRVFEHVGPAGHPGGIAEAGAVERGDVLPR